MDDDGRARTGTVWTAAAHAVAAVIGSGVLAVPWSVAQMGWLFGPLALFTFAVVTYYTARMLADCYRTPDPVHGSRNYTYSDAVRACLGTRYVYICGIIQYILLWGTMVGYVITAATSMASIKRTNCFHQREPNADCKAKVSGNLFMLIYGGVEILLSQFPSLEKITILSVVAATMSFGYSFIALYLCIEKFASHHDLKASNLTGVDVGKNDISQSTKVWQSFQALGNIAFAYTFANILIEIQDTLKSPPAENKTMKRATLYGIGVTTAFYLSIGVMGYMAFGNDAPGNVLTGFHEPFWLVDLANFAVIIHLSGSFQVFAQPIFTVYEKWIASRWPPTSLFLHVYTIKLPFPRPCLFQFTLCKLLLRTLFIILTTTIAMMLPFFNAVLGFLGAISFWPLTVYFPVTMHLSHSKVKRRSREWMMLQSLSMVSLLVSAIATVGSIIDIVHRLEHTKLFSAKL